MIPKRHPTARLPRKRMLPAMLALVLTGTAVPVSQLAAAPAPAGLAGAEMLAAAQPTESGVRVHRTSFKDLGALFPLQLRGVDGTSGVAFSVRNDEVVTGARLKLNYSYSPALLPNLSHIKVLVNEQVAATIPVTTQQAGETCSARSSSRRASSPSSTGSTCSSSATTRWSAKTRCTPACGPTSATTACWN